MTVIAFAGRRRVGKTQAANFIVEMGRDMGLQIDKVSFADPLREAYSKFSGVPVHLLLDDKTKEEYRPKLIKFSAAKKAEDPRIWINKLHERLDPAKHYCIDDLRHLEEIEHVCKNKWIPWKIEADKDTRRARGAIYNREVDESLGETELDLCGHTYMCLGGGITYNNKTMDMFRAEVNKVFREIFLKCGVK